MSDDPGRGESRGDPRKAALLALVQAAPEGELLSLVLDGFEALEQTDFGELEPVGVGAPVSRP